MRLSARWRRYVLRDITELRYELGQLGVGHRRKVAYSLFMIGQKLPASCGVVVWPQLARCRVIEDKRDPVAHATGSLRDLAPDRRQDGQHSGHVNVGNRQITDFGKGIAP